MDNVIIRKSVPADIPAMEEILPASGGRSEPDDGIFYVMKFGEQLCFL